MNIDRLLMLLEVLLLIWVVVQGEYIKFYEREVYLIKSNREKERLEWRQQKRNQIVKKISLPTNPISDPQEKAQ